MELTVARFPMQAQAELVDDPVVRDGLSDHTGIYLLSSELRGRLLDSIQRAISFSVSSLAASLRSVSTTPVCSAVNW